MTSVKLLTERYRKRQDAMLQEFFTFLRFASISTDNAYKQPLLDCASWLIDQLKGLGFETTLWETPGHPTIFASWNGAGPDKPTLLIYNHYDVQPVDPLELWETPPFEPTIRNGSVYARGAQDNKGQCFYVLQALRLLMEQDGRLPINIKLCIEGEEECGSSGLQAILQSHRSELKADYLAIVDLGINSPTQPSLTLGLRGIATLEVEAIGSNADLHSGVHGGLAYNPIHALTEILAKLRDENGRIAVPGFYDDVVQPAEEDLKSLSMCFDHISYEKDFGIQATGGEQDLSPRERNWLRPTIEINGICGGYTGKGAKTVIASRAFAKLSCRLVPNQDPQRIPQLIAKFLKDNAPPGIKIDVKIDAGGGPAVRAKASSPAAQAFAKSLEEVYGVPCQFILEGASIPIVASLTKVSGAEVVMLGLGLITDKIHSPNEHFGVDRLEKGAIMFARGIELL
jgi:acetylornithine deacetylase/succinyl-diaminopimelate desuccinylase-like protein